MYTRKVTIYKVVRIWMEETPGLISCWQLSERAARTGNLAMIQHLHGASSAILVPTDEHGTRGLALVRPKVVDWIYCNGVATMGVRGIHGRVGTLINLTFVSGVTNMVVRSSIISKFGNGRK
jgi:hypothetical protein